MVINPEIPVKKRKINNRLRLRQTALCPAARMLPRRKTQEAGR
jgi:hypothetical protein